MKRWGLVMVGAGAGGIAGALSGRSAMVPAMLVAVVGLFALLVRPRAGNGDPAGTPAAGSPEGSTGTSVHGLGSRVEDILDLAEKQAADHVAQARATAAEIVAQARAEADRRKAE